MKYLNYKVIIILIISIVLTSITTQLSYQISKQYFKNHSFFYDPVMTFSTSIPFYNRMQKEAHLNQVASRLNFAKLHFEGNPKSPIYFIPVILFAPKLLLTPWSTLPVTAFMLCTFLFILGYSVHLRNKNLLYSITLMCLFCAAPVLLDPFWGLSSGWFDMPAGFLLSASIISFINWHNYRKPIWLILFPVLASLAVLGRSILSLYAVTIIAPLLIYSLYFCFKQNGRFLKNIIKPTFIILLISGIVCGYYLYLHFNAIFFYYAKVVYSKTDSVIKSAGFVSNTIGIVGKKYMLFIIILFAALFIKYLFNNKFKTINFFFYAWILLILPFFWIFILKSTGVYHVYLVEYSLLFILFLPFNFLDNNFINSKILKNMNYIIIIISCCFILTSYYRFSFEAKHPNTSQRESKKLDITIAGFVKNLKPDQTWVAFFDEDYSRIPNCECFYRYGIYPEKYSKMNFYLHNEYWNSYYPDLSSDEIADSICKNIDKLSLIITFNNVNDIDKFKSEEDFRFARNIAKKVATYMQTKPNWEKKLIYKTKAYSDLAFYLKKD